MRKQQTTEATNIIIMPMKDMTELERQCIYNMVEMLDGFANEIPSMTYKNTLAIICIMLPENVLVAAKKYPTLYSFRYHVTADAKSTFTKQEVAALLGHASDETAGLH